MLKFNITFLLQTQLDLLNLFRVSRRGRGTLLTFLTVLTLLTLQNLLTLQKLFSLINLLNLLSLENLENFFCLLTSLNLLNLLSLCLEVHSLISNANHRAKSVLVSDRRFENCPVHTWREEKEDKLVPLYIDISLLNRRIMGGGV